MYEPGNAAALAATVRQALGDPVRLRDFRQRARRRYEALFTPERNFRLLMDIYQGVLAQRGGQGSA